MLSLTHTARLALPGTLPAALATLVLAIAI